VIHELKRVWETKGGSYVSECACGWQSPLIPSEYGAKTAFTRHAERENVAEGERLRDEAIDRVEQHAPPDWADEALNVVIGLAREEGREFTTDAVWAGLNGAQPPEPRAMGAVMRKAVMLGWIEKTDRMEMSKRPRCHRRPLTVWRSRLRRPE